MVLMVFAYQDIKYRSISAPLVAGYFIVWLIGVKPDVSQELLLSMIPAICALIIYIVNRKCIGAGDVCMLTMLGCTLGLEGCIWVVFTTVAMIIAFVFVNKTVGTSRGYRKKQGKDMALRASVTLEAAVLVPMVLIITLMMINAAIDLHETVKAEGTISWDSSYCVEMKRWLDVGRNIMGDR